MMTQMRITLMIKLFPLITMNFFIAGIDGMETSLCYAGSPIKSMIESLSHSNREFNKKVHDSNVQKNKELNEELKKQNIRNEEENKKGLEKLKEEALRHKPNPKGKEAEPSEDGVEDGLSNTKTTKSEKAEIKIPSPSTYKSKSSPSSPQSAPVVLDGKDIPSHLSFGQSKSPQKESNTSAIISGEKEQKDLPALQSFPGSAPPQNTHHK